MTLSIVIPGQPVAKGRHRMGPLFKCTRCQKNRRQSVCPCGGECKFLTAVAYTDKDTERYENLVRMYGQQARDGAGMVVLEVPVAISIVACFSIPVSRQCKRHKEGCSKLHEGDRHTQRPDVDNIIKSVCDGLNGVVFRDDSQMWRVVAEKRWSETPRVEVAVSDEAIPDRPVDTETVGASV